MNESSSLPPSTPPDSPPVRRELYWRHPIVIVALAAFAFLTWQWVDTRNELRRARADFVRRLSDGDTAAKEARALAHQSQESLQDMQAKLGALESRVAESQGQQATLESLYQEFSRARDERALADVQQAVDIASQQLVLASNVPAALAALQSADARLAALNRPPLQPLRKLIARDIERLQALPMANVASMSLQLDSMLGHVDDLPMAFEHVSIPAPQARVKPAPVRQAVRSRAGKKADTAAQPAVSIPVADNTPGFFSGLLSDLWQDFSQLIRIERLDRPDPALLSPQSATYLRENLRLRLLSARLALLQRDGKVFNEDVTQARIWLERYFDTASPAVADMLMGLKQIEGVQLNVELPSLNETETALRSLKLGSER